MMNQILGYLMDYSAEIVGTLLILLIVNILRIKKRKVKKRKKHPVTRHK